MRDEWDEAEGTNAPPLRRVLLYSDHPATRDAVITGVGRRAAKDLPPIEWVQVATRAAVVTAVEAGDLDLLVLDGEAGAAGGIGVCRQLKDEIFRCPPVLVLLGRREDRWLAASADPDAVVAAPLDPLELADTVARLLRVTA